MILRKEQQLSDYIDEIKKVVKEQHLIDSQKGYMRCYNSFYNKYSNYERSYYYTYDYLTGQHLCTIDASKNNQILNVTCNCDIFKKEKSCIHIAYILLNRYDEIFNPIIDNDYLSSALLEKYIYKNNIKKELNLEVIIYSDNDYYNNSISYEIRCKIGNKKMYNLDRKFTSFYHAFTNEKGNVNFGKELIYNPDEYYFNEKNIYLIHQLKNIYSQESTNSLKVRTIENILSQNENYPITINNHVINYVKEQFPLESNIKKENENIIINFDIDNICPVCSYNFVMYKGDLYHLNKKEASLLEDLIDNEIRKLSLNSNQKNKFVNGLLKIIKDNTTLDDSLKDEIIITKTPDVKIYFDIKSNIITADVKFTYNGVQLNYFDKNSNVLRDYEYENEVISLLQKYKFNINNKKIELSGLDEIVEFIEININKISEKYSVYTSEKLKQTNIKNKINVSSTFSIGTDNIMSYSFNLDGIDNKELVNIFKDIRSKKKYYRLKNGDIINLEDEGLNELEDIQNELEISDEDIINGNGKIQKYRALYLDCLNKNKYKHTTTNNLFNEFIDNFYKYKNVNLTINDKMDILRDYQIIGVKWLYNIYKTKFGGILADEMGLGKTIQTIYFIKQVLKDKKDAKILIVVPTALVYNWKYEFEKFAKEISVSLLDSDKQTRLKILNESDSSVFITSYGKLREDEDYYKDKEFEVMFIDEAQSIKNYNANISKVVKDINSNVKFALTGTPVENSPLELWSIFDFIMPGYLSSIMKFKNKYKIKDFNDHNNKLLEGLSNQIKPFILRRKKQDVIKELPDKIENNIFIELTEKQRIIYAAETEKIKKELDSATFNEKRFKILQLLTKLREICIDPAILYENYDGGSNKIDTLIMILKEKMANNDKVLVFTSFKTPIEIISEKLKDENIPFYVITGDVNGKERNKRVDDFNNSINPSVFLITLKSGGVGLNLTGANTVIHLDLWWNPQAENQATDRAHRIGQKNTVEVIHLVCKGTIEEKILELQQKKLELSKRLIDNNNKDQNILSTLSEKEIKELIFFENKE